MIKLTIAEIPPSNNKFMGNSKSYHIYRNEKTTWEWLVKEAVQGREPESPYKKSIITIRYFFPDKRRRDPDNYSGKWILDGLRKAGVIEDDDFEHISLNIIKGGVDRKHPRTEILIEPEEKEDENKGGRKDNPGI